MKTKKIPMRTCVITKEKLEKRELLRIVKTPSGEVIPDITGKVNGHGAYLKKDVEVINKAESTKVLERILDTKIDASVYEEARSLIIK
ncbi:MAG: YlxR family protein [Ruminococcus sp.]|nr:YlxR family protein [Ruminococcus sp.]